MFIGIDWQYLAHMKLNCRELVLRSNCATLKNMSKTAALQMPVPESRWTWVAPIPAISRNFSAGKPARPQAITAGKGDFLLRIGWGEGGRRPDGVHHANIFQRRDAEAQRILTTDEHRPAATGASTAGGHGFNCRNKTQRL
jgi:hypothetical protein